MTVLSVYHNPLTARAEKDLQVQKQHLSSEVGRDQPESQVSRDRPHTHQSFSCCAAQFILSILLDLQTIFFNTCSEIFFPPKTPLNYRKMIECFYLSRVSQSPASNRITVGCPGENNLASESKQRGKSMCLGMQESNQCL